MKRSGSYLWWILQFGLFGTGGFVLASALGAKRPLAFVAGSLLGGIVAAAWMWQRRTAVVAPARARRWRRGLHGAALALVLGIGGMAGWQLVQMGHFAPLTADYAANFDRLWRAMDRAYPYFELKGIDWQAVGDTYRPQAAAAETQAEFEAVIAAMLNELPDAHTGLQTGPYTPLCRFGVVREIEDAAVVTFAGKAAVAAGVEAGAVITAVNGKPISSTIDTILTHQDSASTPWQARYWAFATLLAVPLDDGRTVTFTGADGDSQTATLHCTEAFFEPAPAAGPLITAARLPSGVGLIRIPTLSSGAGDLVAQFDAALDQVMDAPALILDLRDNGGGDANLGNEMMGRLLAERFVYGHDYFRYPRPMLFWQRQLPYAITPRGARYGDPVVALIDAGTMSSAENVVVGLVDSGRATTVGRNSGGASGFPRSFNLPGDAVARFSTADFRRLDGTPIEGVGLAPHVPVAWTIEDVRQGRDPDVTAAVSLLETALSER